MNIRNASSALLASAALLLGFGASAQAASFTFQKGDIIAGTGNGRYKVFTPTGTLLTTLDTTTAISEDTGSSFDANGNLFVTNFSGQSVSEFDKNGNLVTAHFGSGYDADPESITFNKAGDLFVGQADGTHHVLEFNPSGTLINTFTPAPQNRGTDWIDLASDGKTLYYTSEGTSILRYDISTNTSCPILRMVYQGPTHTHCAFSRMARFWLPIPAKRFFWILVATSSQPTRLLGSILRLLSIFFQMRDLFSPEISTALARSSNST